MAEVLPGDPLSAESLRPIYQDGCDGVGKTLTLRMRSRSLVTYARTTLIATRRPSCVPCDTSANPPGPTSTGSSEQSGMCMDIGIKRCRLHVLQSLLSNFSRSRSDMVSFSRRCSSCQHFMSTLGGGCGKTHIVHFVNALLNFWLRILQKLEEGGDPWEDFPKLTLLVGRGEYAVHNGESASLFWLTTPASCDHTPNGVPPHRSATFSPWVMGHTS